MIKSIALIPVLGQPLFLYLGLLSLILFLLAAVIGHLIFKGTKGVSFKWHPALAASAIIVGIIHMVLGLSLFFNI
ncbi:MAG: hypothetical protein WC564_04595 [Patescibacteria group bacterium]